MVGFWGRIPWCQSRAVMFHRGFPALLSRFVIFLSRLAILLEVINSSQVDMTPSQYVRIVNRLNTFFEGHSGFFHPARARSDSGQIDFCPAAFSSPLTAF